MRLLAYHHAQLGRPSSPWPPRPSLPGQQRMPGGSQRHHVRHRRARDEGTRDPRGSEKARPAIAAPRPRAWPRSARSSGSMHSGPTPWRVSLPPPWPAGPRRSRGRSTARPPLPPSQASRSRPAAGPPRARRARSAAADAAARPAAPAPGRGRHRPLAHRREVGLAAPPPPAAAPFVTCLLPLRVFFSLPRAIRRASSASATSSPRRSTPRSMRWSQPWPQLRRRQLR